jgi:hypothetical protein
MIDEEIEATVNDAGRDPQATEGLALLAATEM